LKIIDLLNMKKIQKYLNPINFFIVLIFLSSCSGDLDFNKSKNKNDQFKKSDKISIKEKLEITISCNEESIEKYLKDGWKIKNKKSREKVCSWKSVPANDNCDIEKDKGCKIIKPNVFGNEIFYLLEK
tara:strand:+ start:319 stop:702 length:384 start_codon:yes stop_codon:yes gene_type:complete